MAASRTGASDDPASAGEGDHHNELHFVPSATDREQFMALIPLHSTAMLRTAVALVGVADAEDVAQEALIRAWHAWKTLRDISALRAWLLRITINVAYQWRRRRHSARHAHLTQPLPDNELDLSDMVALGMLKFDAGTSDHTGALDLRRAINQLPAHFRIIIALHYYADLPTNEIAAAVGIAPATVRTRQHRALVMLRERLESAGIPIRTFQ